MGTAILIDGAFFLKRFRRIEPGNYFDARRAADLAWRWAMAHLNEKSIKHELYRIFFYDCPPLEKQMRMLTSCPPPSWLDERAWILSLIPCGSRSQKDFTSILTGNDRHALSPRTNRVTRLLKGRFRLLPISSRPEDLGRPTAATT